MKVLQINTTVNTGSTGRIAEDIGNVLLESGHESYIAYGRGSNKSKSQLVKIGNKLDNYFHGLKTLIFDKHGFGSKYPTLKFIKKLHAINPDIIVLHNLHGYYLNIAVLFDYLIKTNKPVYWVMHDCWPFTGHCTFFDSVNCEKWKTQCNSCPKTSKYPSSLLFDNSKSNFITKKTLFNALNKIQIITPSKWLNENVKLSFLKQPVTTIYNGINLDVFKLPLKKNGLRDRHLLGNKSVILGVASIWDKRKGLDDFLSLNTILNDQEFQIILIGLSKSQIKALPSNIIGIERTENIQELAEYYAVADAFVNPTWQDNFPTTNIEALACGTPVITYNTGGSPESIDDTTGIVVNKGDIEALKNAIEKIKLKGKNFYQENCRRRAEELFDKNKNYTAYLALFQKIINDQKER